MSIDYSSLTMGEIDTIETLSGQPFAAISDEQAPKGKALAALALIAKRRAGEPAFTWNQAQALTLTEVTELIGSSEDDEDEPEGEVDPKEQGEKPTKSD